MAKQTQAPDRFGREPHVAKQSHPWIALRNTTLQVGRATPKSVRDGFLRERPQILQNAAALGAST